MPVDWPFAEEFIRLGGTGDHKIGAEDGARQQTTAKSALNDLATQPGVILADEVGMGKTYVALAVVASVVHATRSSGRPVIIMIPPGLARKWPREWGQFKSLCCTRPEALAWVRDVYVHEPTELFKVLEDPPSLRPHIVWMTTGCFARGLSDGWTKLALIRLARSKTRMDEETKKRLCKWATTLVRLKHKRGLTPEIVEQLLNSDLSRWHRMLIYQEILEEHDGDPVPQHLLQHQRCIDWSPLIAVLRAESIPGRRGAASGRQLQEARLDFNEACQTVYWDWLSRVQWRAPLLVLDEAQHAKNDNTRLASLLRSPDTRRLVEGGAGSARPLLWEKFDRMLFLTATPFQLGHQELIRVLRSFAAAKWSGANAPAKTRDHFSDAMDELEKRLNENREAGRRFDRLWGRLSRQTAARYVVDGNLEVAASTWWHEICAAGSDDPIDRELLNAIEECLRTKQSAEEDKAQAWDSIRPWLIRHNRPPQFRALQPGGVAVNRRRICPGREINRSETDDDAGLTRQAEGGLPIAGDGSLPFLLAARAQGELAHGSAKGRAFFAEGLCSSYEAFHHTRDNRGDARDVDDEGVERSEIVARRCREHSLVPVSWYEEQVALLIPSKEDTEVSRFQHPKIRAVVERTVDLWLSGEKILLFCFYRETAKALRNHIGRKIGQATLSLAAKRLGLAVERNTDDLAAWFERVARRLADEGSPLHEAVIDTLAEPFKKDEFAILNPRKDQLIQLLAAYVRSPSFIARYLPLDVPAIREALWEDSTRVPVVRAGAAALRSVLMEVADSSAMSMRSRVEEFLRFAKELAERGQKQFISEDTEATDPLTEYINAVAVQMRGGDEEEANAEPATYRVQQPVRMVFGGTKRDTRERLMLAFNSPMFPEILISSAVLGEGVDLHRFCRYVIHHDLCWNPSILEQRTGRLDRIKCKAELTRRPIVIFEPFLSGSADEKMFRVVRDRERWFQIVMGQKFEFDEATSEAIANRVSLPQDLASKLVFDLRRWRYTAANL